MCNSKKCCNFADEKQLKLKVMLEIILSEKELNTLRQLIEVRLKSIRGYHSLEEEWLTSIMSKMDKGRKVIGIDYETAGIEGIDFPHITDWD